MESTTITTNTIFPVSMSSSLQVINEKIRDSPQAHKKIVQVY